MNYKGIYKVLNIGWGWMILLFVVFPIITVIGQFIFLFISLASGISFEFPFMILPLFSLLGVFYWWLWVVGERLNSLLLGASKLDSKWFKRSMYLCIVVLIIGFIYLFTFNLFIKVDQMLPRSITTIVAIFFFIIMLVTTAAYCYNVYFVSNVLNAIFKDKKINVWMPNFPYFGKVWVFPIGIPIINTEIKKL